MQVVTIYDVDFGEAASEADYGLIEQELRGINTPGASLTFAHLRVPLALCDACMEALTSAMLTKTSLQRPTDTFVVEHQFIDSAQMRVAILAAKDRILAIAGVPKARPVMLF